MKEGMTTTTLHLNAQETLELQKKLLGKKSLSAWVRERITEELAQPADTQA